MREHILIQDQVYPHYFPIALHCFVCAFIFSEYGSSVDPLCRDPPNLCYIRPSADNSRQKLVLVVKYIFRLYWPRQLE